MPAAYVAELVERQVVEALARQNGCAKRHNPDVDAVRELAPTVVRAYSRSGDNLGLAQLPWPNVAPGDVLELADGVVARVVDMVHAPSGSLVGALVKVALAR